MSNFLHIALIGLLCTLIGVSSIVNGQTTDQNFPKVNIASPTATAINKHVDFPINLHTGVPQISIPVYTVMEGPLQLPISLSYHASGLKVMELASWVGAGWSLNAGGVVSRSVYGLADETVSTGGQVSFYSNKGFSNYYLAPANGTYGNIDFWADYAGLADGRKDSEPDLFTFSFGAYGGKFYIREDLTPVLIPHGNVKIETILKAGTNTQGTYDYIQGFKITTPDGTKYHFGVTPQTGDVDAVEKTNVYNPASGPGIIYPDVISSWYLYKIQSADNEFEINLAYRTENYGYPTVSTRPCLPSCSYPNPTKIIMAGLALQEISFSAGKVEFISTQLREDVSRNTFSYWDDPNIEAKVLNKIQISAPSSSMCKTFTFSYGYFQDNSTHQLPYALTQYGDVANISTDRKRLKLNSVQETSCDNTTVTPPYVFSYYDEGMVPRRLSFGQDHWGFSNGVTTNTTLIPPVSGDNGGSYYPGDDRETKWPYVRAGSLRMIQYPTGGGTEFMYEPNLVQTTSNCSLATTGNLQFTLNAGMAGSSAGYGSNTTITVETPTAYYYRLERVGSGGNGKLYIDNSLIGEVNAATALITDFIYLSEGTYSFKSYAGPDNGSGVGVLAQVYTAELTGCDPATDRMVGGLRTGRIEKFGGQNSNIISRTFEYENPILYSIPTYIFKPKNEVLKGLGTPSSANGCQQHTENSAFVMTTVSPGITHPLQTVQGYHIGYKRVVERVPNNGYTVHEFKGKLMLPSSWYLLEDVCVRKVNSSLCTVNDPVYPEPPLKYDHERGNLQTRKVYTQANQLLFDQTFTEQYTEDQVGVFGVTISRNPNSGAVLPVHYELKSSRLNWSQQINKTYVADGTSSVQTTRTDFQSSFHNMPTLETSSTQLGETIQKSRYVPDVTGCQVQCTTCITNYLLEVESIKAIYVANLATCEDSPCQNSNLFLGWPRPHSPCGLPNDLPVYRTMSCNAASWFDYQYRLNQARVTYTTALNTFKQNNNCIQNGVSSSNPGVKAVFQLEKNNDLKLLESSAWKDGKVVGAVYYNYQPATADPAKIYLKDIVGTEIISPTTTFSPVVITSGNIQKDSKYINQPLASYNYTDGQPVEITDRNGVLTSYIWGINNTVPVVQAVGANHTDLLAAYTSSPTTIRQAPALSGAQIKTFTYDPLTGITSVTDANGRVFTYEYDKLGKLVRVKDQDGHVVSQQEYNFRIN